MMSVLISLEQSGLATWLRDSESIWALPTVLTIHTMGLGVLVGSAWAFDLRLLGVAKSIPLPPLVTLFRLMWLGFWINFSTGALLFITDASRKGASGLFLSKMLFVALGVVTIWLLKRQVYDRSPDAPAGDGAIRLLAVSSIVVWSAALLSGRMLAYFIE